MQAFPTSRITSQLTVTVDSLMAPKPKPSHNVKGKGAKPKNEEKEHKPTHPQSNARATTVPTGDPRDNLLSYILSPKDSSSVIYHNDKWLLIRDKYPKGTVHFLLMPRKSEFYTQHPFRALQDPEFLASARTEAIKAKRIAGSELRRLLGKYSAQERPRIEVIEADLDPDAVLPAGRDWEAEIKVGVHAYPSMNHMHIHIISRDMHSDCVKKRQHYNAFNTPFFVNLDEFPLPEDDERWTLKVRPYYHDWDFICWRCERNFGNRFMELKRHLDKEFLEWRSE
jgi:aprataxin